MTAFLTRLQLELMVDPSSTQSRPRPLLTRGGRQLWRVMSDFRVQSDVVAEYRDKQGIAEPEPTLPGLMVAEAGYVTDLCSQPQFTMSLLGECAQEPSVPHDVSYSKHNIPRDVADRMLRELCLAYGVPGWKVMAIYAGVRIGGGSHWEPDMPEETPTLTSA